MSNSGLFTPGTCECCARQRDVAVVASVWGPKSHALCVECLQRPAEPRNTFQYLFDSVLGETQKIDRQIKNWYTWIDGKYVHWDNYVYRRKNPT